MLYYSILEQERDKGSELWVRRDGNLWPVFDYKIETDQVRLISDPDTSTVEAVTLQELIEYVCGEICPAVIPLVLVDELTGQSLDIKYRFEHKLVFEVCN